MAHDVNRAIFLENTKLNISKKLRSFTPKAHKKLSGKRAVCANNSFI